MSKSCLMKPAVFWLIVANICFPAQFMSKLQTRVEAGTKDVLMHASGKDGSLLKS